MDQDTRLIMDQDTRLIMDQDTRLIMNQDTRLIMDQDTRLIMDQDPAMKQPENERTTQNVTRTLFLKVRAELVGLFLIYKIFFQFAMNLLI